jgi:hypothetical protein
MVRRRGVKPVFFLQKLSVVEVTHMLDEHQGKPSLRHRSLIAGWAVKPSVQRLSGDESVPVGSWFSARSV